MCSEGSSTDDLVPGDYKIERIIEKYDLEGVGEELERAWIAESKAKRKSLRELESYFNKKLLRKAMRHAGMQPITGEDENIYQLLTADDDPASQTRVKRRLQKEGIDVETLLDDFVSYQTIRRYLTDVRSANYEHADNDQIAAVGETVQRLKSRTKQVAESKLRQLRKKERFSISEGMRTSVDVYVLCPDCGTQSEIQELLDNHGCNCE